MTGEVENFVEIENANAKRPFAFFRATRYGYFAVSAAQTDVPLPLPFGTLGQRLKTKFRNAGVRASEQARSAEDAELLYLQVPRPARLSEDHIGTFLRTKDASHIKNHGSNHVARKDGFNALNAAENLVWEDSRVNRRRGGRDMTELELESAKQALAAEGSAFFVANAIRAGLRAAFINASLEVPLACLDDFVKREGKISLTTVGKAAIVSGALGAVSGAAFHATLGLLPEALLNHDAFKTAMLALGSLGVAAYIWELAVRIKRAAAVKRPTSEPVTIVICPSCVMRTYHIFHMKHRVLASD